ncbi:hypothetical protein QUF72_23005 [Desulfobacterales bacterium HSG2]|nr:hypothetical protein [Desulfobacterales bacterium HSG2]
MKAAPGGLTNPSGDIHQAAPGGLLNPPAMKEISGGFGFTNPNRAGFECRFGRIAKSARRHAPSCSGRIDKSARHERDQRLVRIYQSEPSRF